MLYSYFGNDTEKVRAKARSRITELTKNGEEAVFIPPTAQSVDFVREALGANALFGGKGVYILDMMSEDTDVFEHVLELIPAIRESDNAFVLIEGPQKAAEAKKIASASVECEVCDAPAVKEWNVFALSDALLARDRKTLWILLQEAWRSGRTPEEIIGTLFWQLKMMKLAQVTQSADEAGAKPFVYDKAKRGLKKYDAKELMTCMESLLVLYHEGHSSKRDITTALEAWVLSL